jgi:hypothetical protein
VPRYMDFNTCSQGLKGLLWCVVCPISIQNAARDGKI